MSRDPARAAALPLLVAVAAIVGLDQGLGQIVRDCSLTCNVGFRHAPLAFLALGLVSAPFTLLSVRLIRRWGVRRWQLRSTLLAALGFLAFRALTWQLLRGDGAGDRWTVRAAYIGFYLWLDLSFMTITANLYGLLKRGHVADEQRGASWIGAALYAGGVGGGLLAIGVNGWLTRLLDARFEVARDHLMIGMGAGLLLVLPLLLLLERDAPEDDDPAIVEAGGSAWRAVARGRELRALALSFMATGACAITLDYVFYWIISEQSEVHHGFVELFARFYVWMDVASFLMLASGTGRVVRRLGLGFALLVLPLALVGGGTALLFRIVVPVVLALRIVQECLASTFFEPATERLMLRLDRARYHQVRPILDGLASRLGLGAGAVLLLALTFGLGVRLPTMIGVMVALHVGWVGVLLGLLRVVARPSITPPSAS